MFYNNEVGRHQGSRLSIPPKTAGFAAERHVYCAFTSRIGLHFFIAAIACGLITDRKLSIAADVDAERRWQENGWTLIQQFCIDCHGSDYPDAELDLTTFETIQGVSESAGSMQRVLEMVRFGAMPPEDADVPSEQQRKRLVRALDQTLHQVSCDTRPRPGKVTARRLNRSEYNNSIRDLFGMDLRPADVFPSDEVGAGFDNNGDLLTLSPMLMEKYLTAAEYVASQVLVDPDSLPKAEVDRSSENLIVEGDHQTGRFFGRFLATDSYVWTEFSVPRTGEYRFDIYGGNGRRHHLLSTVGLYDKTGTLRGVFKLRHFGGGGRNNRDDLKLELEAGDHRFVIRKIPDGEEYQVGKTVFDRIDEMTPKRVRAGREKTQRVLRVTDDVDEDNYPFMVRRLTVNGPAEARPEELPPCQDQIVRSMPRRKDDHWEDVDRAATKSLGPLMRRAFRRPVGADEIKPYARLVVDAMDRGETYYRGMQIAISAVLVSPNFLYRIETPDAHHGVDQDNVQPLTQIQLASRLSYFLWSSLPDESLLQDAEHQKLDSQAVRRHVRRMIEDRRSDSLATEFASQWLGLRNLDQHEADTQQFPEFDRQLSRAMRRETEMLFLHIARNNLSVREFLTADYSYLNATLARYYGIEPADGSNDEFVRHSLAGTTRRGILSHAGILTLTSNPTRTSPVMRGKWILENVLGTPPPDPPPGVPELEQSERIADDMTLREQLELHRASPTCAACHRVMDQLGFGLEVFDAVGRHRQGKGVDAAGELPGGRSFNGAAQLGEVLARSEQKAFAKTITRRLMTFALGRELTPYDECSIEEIIESTEPNGFPFADLVLGVTSSRPFLYYDRNLDESFATQPTEDR